MIFGENIELKMKKSLPTKFIHYLLLYMTKYFLKLKKSLLKSIKA